MEKILLINDSGNFGGVQSIFRNIICNCDFSKYDVDILFATNGPIYEEVKQLGYKIKYIQELRRLSKVEELALLKKMIFRINDEIRKNKYDKVYASGFLSCVACGILSYKYKNVKFIWHEHNMPKSKVRKRIIKILGKNIKKILVVSQAIKNHYPISDDNKVKVVHNGIRINEEEYLDNKDKELLNLAIVSRIDRGKGHLEVIEAFNRLKNPNSRLYIIGNATCKDAEVIEEEIKRKCIENPNIIYVGYTKNVEEYYKKMDVIIQASTSWDSLPTVLIEAMNYNCVLLGTRIGGIPEIIDERNGYIVEKEGLVENLINILKNINEKGNITEMQKNSKIVLKEKFDFKKQVDIINDILMKL